MQVAGGSSQQIPHSESGAPAASSRAGLNTPSALTPIIGAVANGPAGLQGAGGLNGSGPLQELVTHMEAGQLGHKMNDSDIYDQLVKHAASLTNCWCTLHHTFMCTTSMPTAAYVMLQPNSVHDCQPDLYTCRAACHASPVYCMTNSISTLLSQSVIVVATFCADLLAASIAAWTI